MNQFFRVGGSVPEDSPSYVKRAADQALYEHLKRGEFCYVLTARQMGKSSLKVRTMKRLRAEGWGNVDVDLTALGTSDATAEQWYFSFLAEITDAFRLEDEFEDWWDSKHRLTPVARMSAFWEEVLLKHTSQPIVIYIDEVDSLLSLDQQRFSTDDFFAAIRAAYNKRGSNTAFQRLNFCIFGVAAPNDLMSDYERTPFNIGAPIPLTNFSLEEATPLLQGMTSDTNTAKTLLEKVLHWTSGQPYLTQKLCQAIVRQAAAEKDIPQLVEQLFFQDAINSDPHFSNIENRILREETYHLKMLEDYNRLLQNERLPIERKATQQLYLKLAGIVREAKGSLVINNRIYRHIFDATWLNSAYDSIERHFSSDLKRWLDSGRSSDALLKGSVLAEAETWANQRDDLSADEQNFLTASRMQAIRAEEEQKRQAERERQTRLLRIALAVALVFAIAAGIAAYSAINNSKIVKAMAQEASNNAAKEKAAAQLAQDRLEDFIAEKRQRDQLRVDQLKRDIAILKESQDIDIAKRKIMDLKNDQLDSMFQADLEQLLGELE